jgi:hypothetical protein
MESVFKTCSTLDWHFYEKTVMFSVEQYTVFRCFLQDESLLPEFKAVIITFFFENKATELHP